MMKDRRTLPPACADVHPKAEGPDGIDFALLSAIPRCIILHCGMASASIRAASDG
jgi:hypothetical protein